MFMKHEFKLLQHNRERCSCSLLLSEGTSCRERCRRINLAEGAHADGTGFEEPAAHRDFSENIEMQALANQPRNDNPKLSI